MGIAKVIMKKGISLIAKSAQTERKAMSAGKAIFDETSAAASKTAEKTAARTAAKTESAAVQTETSAKSSVFSASNNTAADTAKTVTAHAENTAVKAGNSVVTPPQTKAVQTVQAKAQSVKPQLTAMQDWENLKFPRLEEYISKTSKYHNFSDETKKCIDEFCAELLKCAKNRNAVQDYKNFMSKISTLVNTCHDEKAVKMLMSDAKKFTDYLTNLSKISKDLGTKIKGDIGDLIRTAPNLAVMKTLNPKSFNALWNSKGMKEIIEGRLSIFYLRDVKVFDKIDEDFFYKMFDKIEKANNTRLAKSGIDVERVNKYLKVYDKKVCLNPKFADEFITKLEKVNNPELVNNILKKCEFEKFREWSFLNENLIETLNYAVTNPQLVAKALRIQKANMLHLPDIIEIMKNEFKISDELFERFLKFEKAAPECCSHNTLSYVNRFLGVKGADEKLVQKIFDSAADLKKSIGADKVENLFLYAKESNIDILKTSLEKGKMLPEDFFKFEFVTNSGKQLTDGAMSKLYKETFVPLNKALSAKSCGDIFARRLAQIKAESPATYQKLMDINIMDLIRKENFDPEVLRRYVAALENPAIYERLKDSKLLDLIKDKKVSPRIILQMEYGELRPEVISDIQKILQGESLIKRFDTTKDVLKKTKAGDVISVQGKMYINNKGKLEEWKMTEEKFNELFPLVDRFVTSQGCTAGDCYFLTALDGLYKNPLTRGEYYKMFKLKDENLLVTFPAYKDFKGTIKFKGGTFSENRIGADAAPHIQILENVYARTAVRSKDTAGAAVAPLTTDDCYFLYKRIDGGLTENVIKEIIPAPIGQKGISSKRIRLQFPKHTTPHELKKAAEAAEEQIEEILKNYANDPKYVMSYGYREANWGREGHAVAVSGYDALTKTVTLRNPWYMGVEYNIPLDEFIQKYKGMTLSRIG